MSAYVSVLSTENSVGTGYYVSAIPQSALKIACQCNLHLHWR